MKALGLARSPLVPIMTGDYCIGFAFCRGRSGFEAFDAVFPTPSAVADALVSGRGRA